MAKYDPEKYKEWYNKNAEKKRSYSREYYNSNREDRIKVAIEYRKRKPDVTLASQLKCNYGISVDFYKKMLESQDGKCKICEIELDRSTKIKTPHVDHCHNTGKVRGILCSICNASLGVLEKKDFVKKAEIYLKEHETNINRN